MRMKSHTKWIERNGSWNKGFDIKEDEYILLDLSMPKDVFRVGFIWWNFSDFVHKYFPENYSYSRPSDGGYDRLEVKGTISEFVMIFDLFMEQSLNFKQPSLHVKKLRRYLTAYINKLRTHKDVRCLEAYLKDNHPGWE